MRLNIDLTTVLLLAAGGWLWWKYRNSLGQLGPPSDELMQWRGVPINDPIWETWWAQMKESEVVERLQYDGPPQGVEQNYNWQGEPQ